MFHMKENRMNRKSEEKSQKKWNDGIQRIKAKLPYYI